MCKCAWLKKLLGIKKECCCSHAHEEVKTETPQTEGAPVVK